MTKTLPTPAELAILCVLWQRESATVRQVHEELCTRDPVGYTTVLKQLQNMHRKGSVARDTAQRSHVYRAIWSQEQTQQRLLEDLAERAFEGSIVALVGRALGALTEDETRRLAALLAQQ